jgi:hypothetical protein
MRGMHARDVDVHRCALCGRLVPEKLITQHHLTPKEKGGKAEHRAPMCKPCHKQVHATFSNADLARGYADLAALRAAPLLQPFLKWIRKQKPDRNFRTVTSHAHPRRDRIERRRKA